MDQSLVGHSHQFYGPRDGSAVKELGSRPKIHYFKLTFESALSDNSLSSSYLERKVILQFIFHQVAGNSDMSSVNNLIFSRTVRGE